MRVSIEFQLDSEIKLTDNVRRALESDIATLIDCYGQMKDSAIISYHDDSKEPTEEELNDLFQQDHDDQNKEVDDEMERRGREYFERGYDRPIDP